MKASVTYGKVVPSGRWNSRMLVSLGAEPTLEHYTDDDGNEQSYDTYDYNDELNLARSVGMGDGNTVTVIVLDGDTVDERKVWKAIGTMLS